MCILLSQTLNYNYSTVTCTILPYTSKFQVPGHVAQSEVHMTQEPEDMSLIPGPATYFHFSFC